LSIMRRMTRLLCAASASSTVRAMTSPCPPNQAALLLAVLSKLPPGALVNADQLRSLMGVHSRDLCGVPLKQVGGSWSMALKNVLGEPVSSESRSHRPGHRSSRGFKPGRHYLVPANAELQWQDPRPAPEKSTQCLGQLVDGSTTWVTNDPHACDQLVVECQFDSAPHIGLDIEWTPTMVRGQHAAIALLQLATRERCLIVRVGQMDPPLPVGLQRILGATAPVKVGRGIRQDARMLRSQLGAEVNGVVELLGKDSLKSLARSVGGLKLPEEGKWMNNWDARDLSENALRYAAFDSIAAFAIHAAQLKGGKQPGMPSAQKMQDGDGEIQPFSRNQRRKKALKDLRADEAREEQQGGEMDTAG